MSDPSSPAWESPAWREAVAAFGRRLGFGPGDEEILLQALTHRSLSDAAPHGDNERLEFLGDSVLALLVNEWLFLQHPHHREGQLTKLKTRYVSEPALAEAARALDLGSLLALAPPDEAAGVRERPSALSDAFEAVLAALFLTRGIEAAREFVRRELIERIDPDVVWDYKSRLQELLQEERRVTPVYCTEIEGGPAHARWFRSVVMADGEELGEGMGPSKKAAEQAAAREALERLEPPQRTRRRKSSRAPARKR